MVFELFLIEKGYHSFSAHSIYFSAQYKKPLFLKTSFRLPYLSLYTNTLVKKIEEEETSKQKKGKKQTLKGG